MADATLLIVWIRFVPMAPTTTVMSEITTNAPISLTLNFIFPIIINPPY